MGVTIVISCWEEMKSIYFLATLLLSSMLLDTSSGCNGGNWGCDPYYGNKDFDPCYLSCRHFDCNYEHAKCCKGQCYRGHKFPHDVCQGKIKEKTCHNCPTLQ